MTPVLSLIIPASNESAHIGPCLEAVLTANKSTGRFGPVDIIVAANGCNDDTVALAESYAGQAEGLGWSLTVLNRAEGSKIAALNHAETQAQAPVLAYLDADVRIDASLLEATCTALSTGKHHYASGKLRLSETANLATRAYGRFYAQTPFFTQPAPGCGYFAMTRQGRGRWGEWPKIISDDTFARLQFSPNERIEVTPGYDWPLVDGLRALIRVRRRQNAGVDEIEQKYPDLLHHEAKTAFTLPKVIKAALRSPLGFAVYGTVALVVKLTPGGFDLWERGR